MFIPQANLTSLDPVWTTATVTRNYAFLVYETLYGLDAQLKPAPQMVDGHTIEDDGKRWTMKLREGLAFHDGSPVLARDCVASLKRWMKRDALGQTVADAHRCAGGAGRQDARVPAEETVRRAAVRAREDAAATRR